MPLGISESLIQRAYAPVDLSGFYKGIDEASKRASAERKAQKILDQKEFTNTQAAINKNINGINSADSTEINNHISKWKSATQRRNNIDYSSNPELWSKLDEEANSQYNLGMEKIELSKSNIKQLQANINRIRNNPTEFEDGALGNYTNLLSIPTSESIKILDDGLSQSDISRLQVKGPTTKQMLDMYNEIKDKGASGGHVLTGEGKNWVAGIEIESPDYNKIGATVSKYQKTFGHKWTQKWANENKNDIEKTAKEWDAFPEEKLANIKILDTKTGKYIDKYPADPITGKRKFQYISDPNNPEGSMISQLAAQAIMYNPIKEGKSVTHFPEGEVGKKETMSDINKQQTESLLALKDFYSRRKTLQAQDFITGKLNNMKKLNFLETLGVKTAAGAAAGNVLQFQKDNPDATDDQIEVQLDKAIKIINDISSGKTQPQAVLPGSPSTLGSGYTPPSSTKLPKTKGKPY